MIKMYNAEVLSKFPVVQHFPFGSLFTWERDPNASSLVSSVHMASQPTSHQSSMTTTAGRPSETTHAPWANTPTQGNVNPIAASRVQNDTVPSQSRPPATRAPWVVNPGAQQSRNAIQPPGGTPDGPTRAPWAKR
jgi:serine/threonine-protein phosphatase 2A activator